jgi:hypothetical protein
MLSQVRLRFDADLTENVSAVVQLLNERVWGAENEEDWAEIIQNNNWRTLKGGNINPSDTDIVLDLGYFTMKDMFDYPLTVTLGRQPIKFGRGLIIGDPSHGFTLVPGAGLALPGVQSVVIVSGQDAYIASGGLKHIADDLSLKKAFDAARATLDYSPWVIDMVWAKSWEGNTEMDDDVTLMGANAAYDFDENTQIEGYVWYKAKDDATILDDLDTLVVPLAAGHIEDENDKIYTLGVRAETAVTDQLSLFGEYAYQFGDYINVWNAGTAGADLHAERDAFAIQVGGGFQFDDDNNSAVSVTYTYLSGDDDAENDEWEQWDPMYEDQRGGEIANLFFNTGVQCVKVSGSTMPREDLTAILDVYWYGLTATTITQAYDGAPGTNLIAYATGPLTDNWYWINRDERDLGWEVDASLIYDYTEDVQMGLVSGWFMPGEFFASQNDEVAYSMRAYAKVDF